MGKIYCPQCNELAFSRISYDNWWCEFCHYSKGDRNNKIETKGDKINA